MTNKYFDKNMVLIPEGNETIRHFHDKSRWISSNSQMCIPVKKDNLSSIEQNIQLAPFYISKYPVTNLIYNKVKLNNETIDKKSFYPKTNISWLEAIEFCNTFSKLQGVDEYYLVSTNQLEISINKNSKGFRLPTEAEWQYACKAGINKFQYSDIDLICWHSKNSDSAIHEVGKKEPNSWGLYDMLGNTWEWCWNLYNKEIYDSYRVFRGGSFAEEPGICGATTRRKSHPTYAIEDLGFRLAKSK